MQDPLHPHNTVPSARVKALKTSSPMSFLWTRCEISLSWDSGRISGPPVQFRSVIQSCLTLCDPMDFSTSVHHQLRKPTQTHVHHVGDAIQTFHPLLSPSPPALNLSQHQGLFQWVGSLHQVAKVPCLIRLENCCLSLVISLINTKPLGPILFYFSSTIILLFMLNITTFFL